MGAWGTAPFDNDDAGDWVYELELVTDLSVCRNTFMAVITETDYLERDGGGHAIAAAEVVAALAGRGRADLPEGVQAWITANPVQPDADDIALAVSGIDRVMAPNSELRALWAEVGDGLWETEIDDLRARLGSPAT